MNDIIGNKTIFRLLQEMTTLYSDKKFLIFEDKEEKTTSLTYTEFYEKVLRLASALHEYGIIKGDKVLLHLPNSLDFMISWFAITSIGGVMVPTNIQSTSDEMEFLLLHSEAKLVITENEYVDKFSRFHLKNNALFISRYKEVTKCGVDLQRVIENAKPMTDFPPVSSNDIAAILYTSGTTSKPKGVLVTHANYLFAGEIMHRSLQLSSSDRVFITLPIFHGNGQYYLTMPALTVGASIAITEKFSASKYFKQAKRLKATVGSLFAAPIKMILNKPYDPMDADNNMRLIVFAQSVTLEQLNHFEKRYRVPLCQLYGMTETVGTPLINPIHGVRNNLSIGKPNLSYNVKLVDENDFEVEDGEEGQIIVSGIPGRTIMAGYFKNEQATDFTIKNGWLYTGDIARKNLQDDFYYFVDRQKDMIKRSGENVAASEVEYVINQHEAVYESVVIGVPDEIRDEAIYAFVILKENYCASSQEIIDFCKQKLVHFKVPEKVYFTKEFPRTSVGKIQKNILKINMGGFR